MWHYNLHPCFRAAPDQGAQKDTCRVVKEMAPKRRPFLILQTYLLKGLRLQRYGLFLLIEVFLDKDVAFFMDKMKKIGFCL